MFRSILFAIILWLALGMSAQAADVWTSVRTKNFFLIGDAAEKDIRSTAERLEKFRETFRQLFPQIKLDGGVGTNVIVFKTAASYAPFKPKRPDGTVDEIVKGFFQPGEDVNYITLSVGEKEAYNTIFHEYVHFLLDVNIGRSDLPPWFGEGLAEYFETMQFTDDGRLVLGTPPSGHLALLRGGDLIPFKTFFTTDNASLHADGDESRGLFYAQAWALTHYLLHADRGGTTVDLNGLLASAKQPDPKGKTLDQSLWPDHAVLEKSLREYIARPQIPSRTTAAPQMPGTNAAVSALMTDAQASAYLGDLLSHSDRLDEAETLLRKSLKADAENGVANASLGLLLSRRKNFSEAKKHLEKAIAVDRFNYAAFFNYAYALSREGSDAAGNVSEFPPEIAARMRDALRRAIELNPGFAESYRLLAFVNLVNDTDLDGAVDLLKKGLAIRPGDQHFNLVLAQVLLRQEKYDEAARIAEKLSVSATDADVWLESRGILRTVAQFNAAKTAGPADPEAVKAFGPIPPLILKRSTLSDDEVARYEEDRQITNLNLYIDRPRFGEKQVIGRIDRITCRDGRINYAVRAGDENFSLFSNGFGGVNLRVLTEGENSFTLDCGVAFGKQLTVLTYRPADDANPADRGRLISINFVPDYFRLKTIEEMAKRRTVIIEDDRVFKSRTVKAGRPQP